VFPVDFPSISESTFRPIPAANQVLPQYLPPPNNQTENSLFFRKINWKLLKKTFNKFFAILIKYEKTGKSNKQNEEFVKKWHLFFITERF
jgi:hypothetical protein